MAPTNIEFIAYWSRLPENDANLRTFIEGVRVKCIRITNRIVSNAKSK